MSPFAPRKGALSRSERRLWASPALELILFNLTKPFAAPMIFLECGAEPPHSKGIFGGSHELDKTPRSWRHHAARFSRGCRGGARGGRPLRLVRAAGLAAHAVAAAVQRPLG